MLLHIHFPVASTIISYISEGFSTPINSDFVCIPRYFENLLWLPRHPGQQPPRHRPNGITLLPPHPPLDSISFTTKSREFLRFLGEKGRINDIPSAPVTNHSEVHVHH